MSKLYFAKSHEWVLVEGETAKIGISVHAAKELGDLVFIELPSVGASVVAGKPFCNVESVKAVSEIYSPASGKVIAVNEQLEGEPEVVNSDAANAWFAQIELSGLGDGLMSEEEYLASIGK